MFSIKKYDGNSKQWNSFLRNSKNGTFLFNRNYMEYHSDRFFDYSLMVYNEKSVLIALFPASIHGEELRSHGGLTYGGFIVDHTMRTEKMLQIFQYFIEYVKSKHIKKIVYKAIPHIYHTMPSEEDLYSLFRYGFKLFRRDVSSTINMRLTELKGQKRNGANKAAKLGMSLVETYNSENILKVVNTNLEDKYNVTAVHTSEEMNLLKTRFKKNIIMYDLAHEGEIVGGAILYIDNNVVHAQYITTTYEAKKNRGLDFIIVSLIDMYKDKYEWFDFGISTENQGMSLNGSLIKSKEEFNMSAVCYDFYELEIK